MEECYIPLTIEKQLKAYSECPGHIERHEVLWHEWNHNKRWLTQVQQLILPSFPSYSRHDVSHSEAVLHNIEMLLGEANIGKLSATDCFVLLHTVYIHDIGMCITYEERAQILKDGKFHEYLERLVENGNTDMSYYASILLRECFKKYPSKPDHVNTEEERQYILDKKLEVYYAITYLVAEFRRKEHGDVSKKRLEEWIDNPDKLGVGFSTIEIPDRLFYIIANCAAAHTKWDFKKEVLKLNQEDSGFVRDYVHPRFIAVLLQLGDALDMDNDRFHPLTKEYLGKIPKMSEIHYRKHKAIRRLRITNEKISISADCQTQDELRLIRSECDGIEDILKNATFYWSVIKPKKSNMCLPTLDKTELLLDGKQIPVELVKAQFEIPQEKAFELLKGNNIYTEEHFVFLRELIQNAVDATKIQYFRDYRRNLKRIGEEEKRIFSNPVTIGQKNDPLRYPIDIELSMKKCKVTEYEDISEEDLKNPEERLAEYECGVLVKITDYATGISKEDIEQIANVGSSYPSKEKEIKEMPTWLRPTGTFGIGLQSVFLSAKVLKATTHALTGEPYEIVFHPRHEGEAGYINVTPRNIDVNTEPFGSCFEVFVPYFKKKMHHENPETWDGADPFEENYEKTRPIRHTRELMKQMALYIGDLVGEALFPINLTLRDCDSCDMKKKENLYDKDFRKRFSNVSLSIYFKYTKKCEKFNLENPDSNVTWAYNLGKNDEIIHEDDNGDIYRLDCDRAELYIWNQKYSAYACVGINRIWDMRRRYNMPDTKKLDEGIKIFYKGIQVTHTSFDEDANLIEYIDLKETLKKEYLKLNRKGFSQEGYEYLGEIYHDIIKTARKALNYFGTSMKDGKYEYLEKITDKIKILLEDEKDRNVEKAEKIILSATALVYFAMLNEKEPFCGRLGEQGEAGWNSLLDEIIGMVKSDDYFKKSTLYRIPLAKKENEGNFIKENDHRSVMEIISSKNKYAILSERDEKSRQWVMYLIEVNDFHEKIKKKIAELKSTTEWSERRKLIIDIDQEGADLLEKMVSKELETESCSQSTYSEEKNVEFLKIRKEQVILKWILSNIPTMAIFAYEDGNRRLNLLDVDINNSVYYDTNMKNLVIERITELAGKAKRFSVPAWSGFEYICLEKMRKSIKFVNRGKMSEMSYHEMIFPFTGVQLQKIVDEYKKTEEKPEEIKKKEKEIKELYDSAVSNILSKIENNQSGLKIQGRYWEMVNQRVLDIKTVKEDIVLHDIEENEYDEIIKSLKDDNHSAYQIWDTKLVPALKRLKELWKDYDKELERYEYNLGREAYNEYCKNQVQYNILSEYVQKNGKMKPSLNQINTLYFVYICEIMQVMRKRKDVEFIKELTKEISKNNKEEFMKFIFKW